MRVASRRARITLVSSSERSGFLATAPFRQGFSWRTPLRSDAGDACGAGGVRRGFAKA